MYFEKNWNQPSSEFLRPNKITPFGLRAYPLKGSTKTTVHPVEFAKLSEISLLFGELNPKASGAITIAECNFGVEEVGVAI